MPYPERRPGSYEELRRNLGRSILLGLEVLIVADIMRTIIVDPTYESVFVSGVIVWFGSCSASRSRSRWTAPGPGTAGGASHPTHRRADAR